MAMGRRILPAFGYGLAFGLAFYMLGGVANPTFSSVTSAQSGALGFIAAFTIALTEKEYKEQKGGE